MTGLTREASLLRELGLYVNAGGKNPRAESDSRAGAKCKRGKNEFKLLLNGRELFKF